MSNNLILYETEHTSFKDKFFILMNILVSNQSFSRIECIIFLGVSYIQILSGFYSIEIGVLKPIDFLFDRILNDINNIFRFRDLIRDNASALHITLYIITAFLLLYSIYFLIRILRIKPNSFYSMQEFILNLGIKLFIYVIFNIQLDLFLSLICFTDTNPYFTSLTCNVSNNIDLFLLSFCIAVYSIIALLFIQFYYTDSLFLSTSYYAKISCRYELYTALNSIVYAILLNMTHKVNRAVFFVYNASSSLVFLQFYLKKLIYYDWMSNNLCGLFHFLYVWTAAFFFIFAYIDIPEKGVIYFITSIAACFIFFNQRQRLEEKIFITTPYYQILNKDYLLYYIKSIIDKINRSDETPEDKSMLTGIIQLHIIECPNPKCITKNKNRIYLPITNQWSDRTQPCFLDKAFLKNFILAIVRYFISLNFFSPEMIINISLYYLRVIGNFCQSIYYYQKVKEMPLTLQEQFAFMRLKQEISQTLIDKLKKRNEPCYHLVDLNVTYFFEYETLVNQFHEEISNDIQLSLDFWKAFVKGDSRKIIDFNKVFKLTDKIRIAKANVERIWERLFKIYNGVNELFLFYYDYVEQVNDDNQLKRELESIKRKSEISTENIQQNFYNVLFNSDTGIIILNGDHGKEGVIERVNVSFERIFKYNPDELRGMNITSLMPKIFAKDHKTFMQKYFEVGERNIVDVQEIKTFAKDKDNSLLQIRVAIKLFPILNDSVYFIGLMTYEKVDDVILIDSLFNIQGMSRKLMEKLSIDNKFFFSDYDIPFYVICKKFVNFYKIFLQGKRPIKSKFEVEGDGVGTGEELGNEGNREMSEDGVGFIGVKTKPMQRGNDANGNGNHVIKEENEGEYRDNNIEINENIELEYEIKVPTFLIEFSTVMIQRRDIKPLELKSTQVSHRSSAMNHISYESINDYEDEEVESLVSNTGNDINNNGKTLMPNTNQIIDNTTKAANDNEPNSNASPHNNKHSNEEKDFLNKIDTHRKLFTEGNFQILEDLIDEYTNSSPFELKFNFTFEKYKFGDKKQAYVIRCVDNKNEVGIDSDEDSDEFIDDNSKLLQCKRDKTEHLKPLIELYPNEKDFITNTSFDFLQLSLEDSDFQTRLINARESIKKLSRVHGQKKEQAIMDDENSSQSSQAGYNSDLCKINRIEEIRGNLMRNVSNFYTLKWIKVVSILLLLFTGVFCGMYMYIFDFIIKDIKGLARINSNFYICSLQITQITSSVISLRSLYTMRFNNWTIPFNSFIPDETEYFESLREMSKQWYRSALQSVGYIEQNVDRYINNTGMIIWDSKRVNYSYPLPFVDYESFPLGISQTLINMNHLLNHPHFTLNRTAMFAYDSDEYEDIVYSGYMAVENCYDNIIPNLLGGLTPLLNIFLVSNKNKITYVYVIVFTYGGMFVLLAIAFMILLLETNKNMGEGLEKVAKISGDKMEEIIRRLEGFLLISKKKEKKALSLLEDMEEMNSPKGTNTITNTNANAIGNNNAVIASRQFSGGNSSEYNDNTITQKKLSVIKKSLGLIPFVFIIKLSLLLPLFFITKQILNCNADVVTIQSFLFGRILLSSSSTVAVKCIFSNCKQNTTLDFYSFLNMSLVPILYQGLKKYKRLDDYYSKNFLLNACGAAYDNNTVEYSECLTSPMIKSLNNTDSLLKLITDDATNLIEEMMTGLSADKTQFNPFSLYNSSSFHDLETAYYKYIVPIALRIDEIIYQMFEDVLKEKKLIIILLIASLALFVVLFTVYLQGYFLNHLIHLLSVSRCIVKIIPTVMITTTQELENWIEHINVKTN